jgi:LysR family cyn operon transcriptional activator
MTQHDLILLDKGFATRQHIDRYFQEQGVTPRVAVETNSVSAIIELVRRGQLATVLPDATALHQADLSFVAVSPPLPQRTAALLRRAGAHESAASKAFAALGAQDARERHGPTRDPG